MSRKLTPAGLDDFDGLSPAPMSDLLYMPLASPHRLEFAQSSALAAQAPVMILFDALADAIGKDGLRTTAKGNLPARAPPVCRRGQRRPLSCQGAMARGRQDASDYDPLCATQPLPDFAIAVD